MSEKRRDSKNRILRRGESQRKDGRYVYKYIDIDGKTRFVYSWTLEKHDVAPKGKKVDISLREKEKEISQSLNEGLSFQRGNYTVLTLVQKYLAQKGNIKQNSQKTYNMIVNILNRDSFGNRKIGDIRTSNAKSWCIGLQKKEHRNFGTIRSIKSLLKESFQVAVDDDYIRKNPFAFNLSSVIFNDSKKRDSLSLEQEKIFLNFVKNDKYFCRYYDGICILFETGLRISEFVGLTINDVDLKNRKIHVGHQLLRNPKMEYYIESEKTEAGNRDLPMTKKAYECFQRILENRKTPKIEPVVDGLSGFLFLDRNEKPTVSLHWENYFIHICKKYNELHPNEPIKITPHVCRHTFCSKMANLGMHPKTLSYLMGHSNINITLGVYAHAKFHDVEVEVERVLQSQ